MRLETVTIDRPRRLVPQTLALTILKAYENPEYEGGEQDVTIYRDNKALFVLRDFQGFGLRWYLTQRGRAMVSDAADSRDYYRALSRARSLDGKCLLGQASPMRAEM